MRLLCEVGVVDCWSTDPTRRRAQPARRAQLLLRRVLEGVRLLCISQPKGSTVKEMWDDVEYGPPQEFEGKPSGERFELWACGR